jgi:hypothetical protein
MLYLGSPASLVSSASSVYPRTTASRGAWLLVAALSGLALLSTACGAGAELEPPGPSGSSEDAGVTGPMGQSGSGQGSSGQGNQTGGSASDSGTSAMGSDAGTSPRFPVGTYSCQSNFEVSSPDIQGVESGGGTLTLTQAGATVTAGYTGDYAGSGTLQFHVTTPDTAATGAGQSFEASCLASQGPSSAPVAVSAGSLTMDGVTLFLTFSGTMSGACGGGSVTATLTCTLAK